MRDTPMVGKLFSHFKANGALHSPFGEGVGGVRLLFPFERGGEVSFVIFFPISFFKRCSFAFQLTPF